MKYYVYFDSIQKYYYYYSSTENLLDTYLQIHEGPKCYFFAAFTLSIDAQRYCNFMNDFAKLKK
jgi:hypothetical protein